MSVDQFERSADAERRHEWDKYMHDRGIKSIPEIFTQYVQAAVAGLVGLFLLSIPIRRAAAGSKPTNPASLPAGDSRSNTTRSSRSTNARWRDKGIAKVTYVADGRTATVRDR